jgi:hypothetical protein
MNDCKRCIYKKRITDIIDLFNRHISRTNREFIEAVPHLMKIQEELKEDLDADQEIRKK